eukprot:TRINITY_DN46642_c0_g1_i1.p1 TRINITY_DN46642_c0_g1~~TRINITY_DN46642_c0_g1_i1.p1  ORF type:complete len:479 (+),score=189.64 TRINITY_DN46642_c0_g1_i1:45-1439(+)
MGSASKMLLLAATTALASGAVNESVQCYNHQACRYKPLANLRMAGMMAQKEELWKKCQADHTCPMSKAASGKAVCVNGVAIVGNDRYPCHNIDVMSFIPAADLGSAVRGNDVWGWTDPEYGNEIAIMCLADGTSFVDITNAENPTVLGYLPGTNWPTGAVWRDAKVYDNHVFIGSEVANHGLQIFDLTGLRPFYGKGGSVVPRLSNTAFYGEFGSSHNIVINEETGFLYSVGSKTYRGGPHIVDIRNPKSPKFAAGYDTHGYTHDAQCVIYKGPHEKYQGREICFNYNEDALLILDVTDKANMIVISNTEYNDNYYCHQGWLNDEMSMLIMDDELDEEYTKNKHTRSLLWDVSNLEMPVHIGDHISTEMSIDHNMYIHNNIVYQSNYCSGLRVLDGRDIGGKATPELAWFDIAPYCDTKTEKGVDFQGTWSNYPYFKSGNIAVSSIELGLFIVRVQDGVLPQNN